MKLDLELFNEAFDTIDNILEPSPLVKNIRLSQKYGANIFLKLENMLPVGSFKMRGAIFKMSKLSHAEKKAGVLAVSAGNHAQGVAWAAREFGVKATIIMPETSPLTKILNTRELGAKVILKGINVEEGFQYAKQLLKTKKMTFVHPFEDPFIIAGQGSIGYEIGDQIDRVDYLYGSIGGGGLITGLGTVIKEKFSKAKVVGAQASGANSMVSSLKNNKIIQPKKIAETFADGIKVTKPSPTMFKLLSKCVDDVTECSEQEISIAVLDLMEKAQIIAEGAGALPLAAFEKQWKKNPTKFKNKNIVLVICGGNIDVNLLGRIIDRGLIYKGRRARLEIEVDDVPGVLSQLTGQVSKLGGNILQVIHDNESPKTDLMDTLIEMTIETTGPKHIESIVKALSKQFRNVRTLD